jgi:RND family efflux transporter MFP subunit
VLKAFAMLASLHIAAALAISGAVAADYKVAPVTVTVMKSVYGEVQTRDTLAARARIGGTVRDISVKVGDEVAEGDVVANVVDPKLALKLDALDAQIKSAVTQFDNARTTLERTQTLFQQGASTKSSLDQAQTNADVLASQLNAVKADRTVVVQQAREGAVLAPGTGRVLTVPLAAGSVILPGETVAMMATGGYFLRLALPERYAGGIAKGGEVMVAKRGVVRGETAAATLKGTIITVYPEIENGRVMADVEVPSLGGFFVGERTLVSLPIATRETIAVPPKAVITRHGLDFVTVKKGTETFEVSVIPGETVTTSSGPMTEILTGLQSGDEVVVP